MADNQVKWLHVRDYLAAAQSSEEKFASRYNHPFFILVGPKTSAEGSQGEYFTTHHCEYNAREVSQFADGKYINALSIVFPVAKRSGANPYAGMITIGRADNCDIIIPSPGVSKFHCFIRVEAGNSHQYLLSDGGSRNGTRLNETQISQRQQMALKTGDMITLGAKVTLCFFFNEDFQEILRNYEHERKSGRIS